MEKQLKILKEAIVSDYRRWNEASKRANDFSFDVDEKVDEFEAKLEIKEGSKYIRIDTDRSVWGFVNKANPKFEVGDILKAAGYRAPALNRARGNIFREYSVAWTGPHYIAGYSAGGERKLGLNRGHSRMVSGEEDGS
tara:strand:- start:317 stop:730 length:414 start_codon:yes stop_codon:yes gene_type:complete